MVSTWDLTLSGVESAGRVGALAHAIDSTFGGEEVGARDLSMLPHCGGDLVGCDEPLEVVGVLAVHTLAMIDALPVTEV